MVSLNDAKADAAALRDFVTKTGFARYAVSGSAAPGEAFTIHQRDRRREGFGNSSSQITLPAGNYRVMLFDSIWSEGTANPQSIVVDLYDVGAAAVVVSFSVDRPSADPSDAVGIADPLLYVEDDVTLVGPIELRNGGSANQRAALVARIWPLPESWPRPDPQALYFRTWHLTRPVGASLGLFGAFELDDENVRRSIKTVDATSQVP